MRLILLTPRNSLAQISHARAFTGKRAVQHFRVRRAGGKMRANIRFYSFAVLAVLGTATPNADAAVMMGIQTSGASTLWDINPSTAATSNPRNTNIPIPIDIAVAPDGRIFSANA